MKTEKQIKSGLKKLQELDNEEELLHLDFALTGRVNLPPKGGRLEGTVALDLIHTVEDMEKIIRATEICTLKWVLGEGGGLNTKKWELKPKPT